MTRRKTLDKHRLYIGWDVGGWNCDCNRKSRDALCVLGLQDGQPAIMGRPRRGNLREILVNGALSGLGLVRAMLDWCDIGKLDGRPHITIAIDTPLGWPTATINLLTEGLTDDVGEVADDVGEVANDNPYLYLFRNTERELIREGIQPLSVVRDMIGSQSTKGIHFLQKARLKRESAGVWRTSSCDGELTAIETYPAPCKSLLEERYGILIDEALLDIPVHHTNVRNDTEDAALCAIVAYLFDQCRDSLADPPDHVPESEGWIWVPRKLL